MRDEARKLRLVGLTFDEISEKLNVDRRKIRYWTEDIKLSKEQIAEKIRRIKIVSDEKRYEGANVEKGKLEDLLLNNGFYKAVKLMGLTEGVVRYWCRKYNIEIKVATRDKPDYKECSICNKQYNDAQCKRKICNTCVSKLRRRFGKIKAINYLGGKCNRCGYAITDDNFAAFEFHHPDDNKDLEIGSILNRKWETIEEELKKCELLCSNCHRISHSDYGNTTLMQAVKDKYVKENKISNVKINILKEENNKTGVVGGGVDVLIDDSDLKDFINANSVVRVANKFGVSPYVITKICRDKNIKIPDKHYLSKKFDISKEDLEALIKSKPMTEIGKTFGVSDNAIRKRCKTMGIDWKLISKFSHGKSRVDKVAF